MPTPFEYHKQKFGPHAREVQAGMDVKGECMVVYEAQGWGVELGGSLDLGKFYGPWFSAKPELALRYKRTRQRMLLTAVCPPRNPLDPRITVDDHYLVASLRGFEGSLTINLGAFVGLSTPKVKSTGSWNSGTLKWDVEQIDPYEEPMIGPQNRPDWELSVLEVDARLGLDVKYSGQASAYLLVDDRPAMLKRDDFLPYLQEVYDTGVHNWRVDAIRLIEKWKDPSSESYWSWAGTKAVNLTRWTLGMSPSEPSIGVETESERLIKPLDDLILRLEKELKGTRPKTNRRRKVTADLARAKECRGAAGEGQKNLEDPGCFVQVSLSKHDADVGLSAVTSLGLVDIGSFEGSLKAGVSYKKRSMQSTLQYAAVAGSQLTMTQETHTSMSQLTLPWGIGLDRSLQPKSSTLLSGPVLQHERKTEHKKEGNLCEFFNRVTYRTWVTYWERAPRSDPFVGARNVEALPGSGYLMGQSVSVKGLYGLLLEVARAGGKGPPAGALKLANGLGVAPNLFLRFLNDAQHVIKDLYGESGQNTYGARPPARNKFKTQTEYQQALDEYNRNYDTNKKKYLQEMDEQFQLYRNGAVIIEAAFAYRKSKKGNVATLSATRRSNTAPFRLSYPRQKPQADLQALRLRWRASDFQGSEASPFKLGFSGPGQYEKLLSINIGLLTVEQAGSERFADICVTEFAPYKPLHTPGDDSRLVPPAVLFLPCNA